MREGRRQRLGLQEGTEGTVEDTYLDRILEEEGPRTLALDPGAFVDTTDQRYVQDAYNYYLGGGFPEEPEPVIDTPVVDTTPVVDAGGGGGGQDLVTGDLDLGGNTDFEQDLIDQGIGVQGAIGDPVVAPGEIPVTQQEMDDFNAIPVTQPMTGGITGDDIEVGIPDSETDFIDPLGTISGAPVVGDFDEPTTIQGSLSQVQVPDLDYSSPQIGDPGFENYTPSFAPEQQGLVDQAFSKVGSTAENIMDDLSKIPGAVVDYANQTVDILGKKINVGKTLLSAGINKIVGGPITLVFDAIKAVAGMLPDGIEATTDKAREIGLLQGDNTVTQDIYGINTQSQYGDYDQYNIDRVEQLETALKKARDKYNTEQEYLDMTTRLRQELKDRKEYNKISGVGGDIDDDPTGDAQIAEQIEADNRAAEADRIEAERRALQEINAAAAREQAAAEQRARDETDARMAAEAASRAAAAAAAAREAARNQGGGGAGNQNTGGARGGGTSATSSSMGNLGFSDIRLKDNVELIGKSPSNINIYKFNYKGDSTVYEGVIANEIPWASVEASNGYLMVDYNKIDVELKKHAKR